VILLAALVAALAGEWLQFGCAMAGGAFTEFLGVLIGHRLGLPICFAEDAYTRTHARWSLKRRLS
jgi:hypothetical protein